jgi:hypothetical protein
VATYPNINGTSYDWSSIHISLGSLITPAIKGIDYSQALEPGEGRGNSSGWLKRTRGQLKPDASFEIYKSEFQDFIDILGDGYMEKVFDVTVSYQEGTERILTDKLIGCRIKKHADSPKDGSDPPTVKVDLHLHHVVMNGKNPTTDKIRTA